MTPTFLEYAHVTLTNQRWYMDHLLPEHLIRIAWCLMLMCIYALVELDYLPGKQWKIRKDLHTTPQEIFYFIKSSFFNMLKWHICPLMLYEILFYRPNHYVYEAPTWGILLWKSVGYTLVFDILTHSFHHVTHLRPQVASYLHQVHAKHHASCDRYTYAWNGFYSNAFESFAGLVFFLVAMIPLQMDPVTRLASILFIHFVATNLHSGYDFPWMFHNWNPIGSFAWHGSVGHYYHHQLGRKNLSTFWTFLDRLSNTNYDYMSHPPLHSNEFIYRREKFIIDHK